MISRLVLGILIFLPIGSIAGGQEILWSLLVEPGVLADHLDDHELKIVDYRRRELNFVLGHIPGAVFLPRKVAYDKVGGVTGMLPAVENVAAMLGNAGITAEDRIVIYDASDGLWASRLFWALEVIGHRNVHILNGGFRRWKAEGRPTSGKKPMTTPAEYTPSENKTIVADTDWLMDHFDSAEIQIIDSRSPDEYSGVDRQAKRGGHIPTAVNVEWMRNLTGGQRTDFLAGEDLAGIYAEEGINPEKLIVTHCQTGVRASHTYFALRLLGYKNLKVYDGSWEVWGNREDTPVEP